LTNLPFHDFPKYFNHDSWFTVWENREKAGLSKTGMSCRLLVQSRFPTDIASVVRSFGVCDIRIGNDWFKSPDAHRTPPSNRSMCDAHRVIVESKRYKKTDIARWVDVRSLWRTKKSHFQASVEMGMKNVDKDAVNTTIGLLCDLVA